MNVILIHAGDVIEHIFLLADHASQAVLNDDGEFVRVGRIVGYAVRYSSGTDQTMTVLMLQTLARQCRASCRTADQEAARLQIATSPNEVANALEAEHRIVNVERHHLFVVIRVRRSSREPGTECTALVDTFL